MHGLNEAGIRSHIVISTIVMVSFFFIAVDSFAWEGALVNAAEKGNLHEVKQLLASEKVDLNQLVDALAIAANQGHVEIMKLLLDVGADPNRACTQFKEEHTTFTPTDNGVNISREFKGKKPLNMALEHPKAVSMLLKHGAIPDPDAWSEATYLKYFDSAELILDQWMETPEGRADINAALSRSAIKGDTKQVRQILTSDAGKNISEADWNMALTAAVSRGYVEIVKEIIRSGSNPDETKSGIFKFTPPEPENLLNEAVTEGHVDVARVLLGTFESLSSYAETLFNSAVDEGRADVLRVLLDARIDPNKMGVPGGCALMDACRKGRIDIVKLLLDKGASANDGSALAAAAGGSYMPGNGGGHLDIVKLLVERGADVNTESGYCLDPSNDYSVTAIQVAAREGHLELVRYLLEKGADPKAEMKNYADNPEAGGDNAVTSAAWKGHTEILKMFLEKGVDINRATSSGTTALMAALSGGEMETVKFLLNRGADVNAADKEGDTPLFYALRKSSAELVKLLVEKGADPNAKNSERLTVLDIARKKNLTEIVAILEAARPKKAPKRKPK
jgi:ankyrin repeat protein